MDDLLDEAEALDRELGLLEKQHSVFLDRLAGPWNELRAIAGLPEKDLRQAIADPVLDSTAPTSASNGEPANGATICPIVSTETRSIVGHVRSLWVQKPWTDWLLAALIGGTIQAWSPFRIPIAEVSPEIRFAAYASVAGGILAFVTIAFTPLALLVSVGVGRNIRRLRMHDDSMRRQYLLGTLVLLGCAGSLLIAGVADAAGGATDTRWIATLLTTLAVAKMLRLTQLFWAILAANARDTVVSTKNS